MFKITGKQKKKKKRSKTHFCFWGPRQEKTGSPVHKGMLFGKRFFFPNQVSDPRTPQTPWGLLFCPPKKPQGGKEDFWNFAPINNHLFTHKNLLAKQPHPQKKRFWKNDGFRAWEKGNQARPEPRGGTKGFPRVQSKPLREKKKKKKGRAK